MLTVYIAGPITGKDDHNKPAFREAARLWGKKGWNAIDPLALDADDHSQSWDFYMRRDIKLLVDADVIALLPGWRESRGATTEATIAGMLDIPSFDANYPASYAQHPFIDPGNICCMKPDYVHEENWRNHHGGKS